MADDDQTQNDSTDSSQQTIQQLIAALQSSHPTTPPQSPFQAANPQPTQPPPQAPQRPVSPQPQMQPPPANQPQPGKVLDQASGAYVSPKTAENVAWTRTQGDKLNQQDQAAEQNSQPQNQWQQIYAALKKQNPQAQPQQLLMSMKAYKESGAFYIYSKNAVGKTVEEQVYNSLIKTGMSATDAADQVQKLRGISPEASGEKETAKNKADISAEAEKQSQSVIGKARGTEEVSYAKMQAGMPGLEKAINSLSNLASTANYTIPQNLLADARRQAGLPVGQGAIDSAQYESVLNNILLPRLRSIFPGRVTNFDVQAAAKMLGNSKLSPPEKQAQLRSFIDQATVNVESEGKTVKNLGGEPSPAMKEDSEPSGSKGQSDPLGLF